MSSTNWIELVIAAAALLVVALSAWVETCLAAASRVNIRRLLDERYARMDEDAIERAQRQRASMLLIELVAGAVVAVALADAFEGMRGDYGLWIGLLVAAFLLVVFGRIVPRVLAGSEPDAESSAVARVANGLTFLLAPLVAPVDLVTRVFTRNRERTRREEALAENGTSEPGVDVTSDRERHDDDHIEEDEQEMISGVLHLESATARDIMVPRIDIVALPNHALISEAVDLSIQFGHSRMPVYGRSIDEIVGVLYAKDLLKFVNEDSEGLTIEPLIRDAYFVPESKRVDDLLNELQKSTIHLAIVVDEYGGTAGVVTIEDILEEIVGEIQDEFDREQPRFEITGDHEAVADGAMSIDDLTDEFDIEWPEPVSGTIGGFLQRQLGRIPSENEVVQIDGVRLTVMLVEHRRVRQVKIERNVAPPLVDDAPDYATPTQPAK